MLQSTIFRDLDNLSKHINKIYETIFKKYGLQRGQFVFITRIVENECISLKELAAQIRVDKTTVTKAIQKLDSAGYIIKIIDKLDNRIIHLMPTEKAFTTYTEIITEKNKILQSVFANFTSLETDSFITMLNSLNNCLDNI